MFFCKKNQNNNNKEKKPQGISLIHYMAFSTE